MIRKKTKKKSNKISVPNKVVPYSDLLHSGSLTFSEIIDYLYSLKTNLNSNTLNSEIPSNTNMQKSDMQKAFDKKFVKSNDVVNILNLAKQTKENVVLYGRGGHGKSEMVKYFFECLKVTPFVKSLGQGTSIEDLFGGMDMMLFQETGKIEYNVENSFMNHEYVVLEEAFDAPTRVLEQLKDVLTSGVFRNGSQQFEIKTKLIIVCTNRNRIDLAEDDSLKALMERFPLELKVEWDSYTQEDYSEMFAVVLGKKLEDFAMLIEEANNTTFISPRTAVKASKVYELSGVEGLEYVSGFTKGIVECLTEIQSEMRARNKETLAFRKLKKYVFDSLESARKLANSNGAGFELLLKNYNGVEVLLTALDDTPVSDKNIVELRQIKAEVKNRKEELLETILEKANIDAHAIILKVKECFN